MRPSLAPKDRSCKYRSGRFTGDYENCNSDSMR
ncbi:MAG: hypothetical protein ACI8XO_002260 [Verrucomicrobiales bacterium]|jgi:hypothetical protein